MFVEIVVDPALLTDTIQTCETPYRPPATGVVFSKKVVRTRIALR